MPPPRRQGRLSITVYKLKVGEAIIAWISPGFVLHRMAQLFDLERPLGTTRCQWVVVVGPRDGNHLYIHVLMSCFRLTIALLSCPLSQESCQLSPVVDFKSAKNSGGWKIKAIVRQQKDHHMEAIMFFLTTAFLRVFAALAIAIDRHSQDSILASRHNDSVNSFKQSRWGTAKCKERAVATAVDSFDCSHTKHRLLCYSTSLMWVLSFFSKPKQLLVKQRAPCCKQKHLQPQKCLEIATRDRCVEARTSTTMYRVHHHAAQEEFRVNWSILISQMVCIRNPNTNPNPKP
eukprot:g75450.t1